mgnify:CR=1 FL=1
MELVLQDYAKAKETIEQCITTNPEISLCWWILAQAEISLGNNKAGEYALERALQTERGSIRFTPEILLKLGRAYVLAKEYPKVVDTYERLVQIENEEPLYFEYLAAAYVKTGEYRKAREAALRMVELDPALKPHVDAFLKKLPK